MILNDCISIDSFRYFSSFVNCSKVYPISNSFLLKRNSTNVKLTGSPDSCPIGTVSVGYFATAAIPE
jgi:hypothetical protein